MQTGSIGTLIGWKSGQTTFVPLWDRMEGAWLRTLYNVHTGVTEVYCTIAIEEGRAASKNLAIFFQCPNTQFLPIPFQIQRLEYFPQKQKEQRQKQLFY
jgi:hypothetical protein